MGLGKRLQELMEERGMKQADLCRAADITPSTLSSIITRDNSKVSIDLFLRICKALDCKPEYFASEITEPEAKKPLEELKTNSECLQAETFIDELAEKYNIDEFVKRALTAYMSLTDSEKEAVKRFFDKLTPPPEDDIYYRAANSSDNHPDEITRFTKEEQERIAKATRKTPQNSDY